MSNIVQLCFELKNPSKCMVHAACEICEYSCPDLPPAFTKPCLSAFGLPGHHISTSLNYLNHWDFEPWVAHLWLYITRFLYTPLTENAWNKLVKLNLKPPNASPCTFTPLAQGNHFVRDTGVNLTNIHG